MNYYITYLRRHNFNNQNKVISKQAKPEEIEIAVSTALECGYRHIDTATNYNNEDAIGKALKKWFEKGGLREELFITTKVIYHKNTI